MFKTTKRYLKKSMHRLSLINWKMMVDSTWSILHVPLRRQHLDGIASLFNDFGQPVLEMYFRKVIICYNTRGFKKKKKHFS